MIEQIDASVNQRIRNKIYKGTGSIIDKLRVV